nr:MAG TPA: hypothetical protein [Caudoviricetes sp.]
MSLTLTFSPPLAPLRGIYDFIIAPIWGEVNHYSEIFA